MCWKQNKKSNKKKKEGQNERRWQTERMVTLMEEVKWKVQRVKGNLSVENQWFDSWQDADEKMVICNICMTEAFCVSKLRSCGEPAIQTSADTVEIEKSRTYTISIPPSSLPASFAGASHNTWGYLDSTQCPCHCMDISNVYNLFNGHGMIGHQTYMYRISGAHCGIMSFLFLVWH